jgi:hypothetical protein
MASPKPQPLVHLSSLRSQTVSPKLALPSLPRLSSLRSQTASPRPELPSPGLLDLWSPRSQMASPKLVLPGLLPDPLFPRSPTVSLKHLLLLARSFLRSATVSPKLPDPTTSPGLAHPLSSLVLPPGMWLPALSSLVSSVSSLCYKHVIKDDVLISGFPLHCHCAFGRLMPCNEGYKRRISLRHSLTMVCTYDTP